jgi:hypothetical protein
MQSEVAKLKALRLQKDLYRHEIKGLTEEITIMLTTFGSDDGDETVTFRDLSLLEYGLPYYVNDKVMFIRQKDPDPNTLLFHTYMKPGGIFGKQSHDVVEHCEVIKGKLVEAMRDDEVYLEGETVSYDKFEVHKPYTDEVSIYHVTFKRDVNLTPEV